MSLDKIFETYAISGRNGWKSFIIDITDWYMDAFSINAQVGFAYLSVALHHDVCNECGDEFAHKWLEDFVTAWIAKGNLPVFYHCCCERNLI